MHKKYYSLNEAATMLKNQNLGLKSIVGYIREEIVKPLIYLNSIPTYACEVGKDGKEAIAIGYCNISAYWNIASEIINIIDNILSSKNGSVEFFLPIMKSKLIGEPKIFSWRYTPSVFQFAPNGFKNPKPQPNSNEIFCFMIAYPHKRTVTLTADDVFLTREDLLIIMEASEEPISVNAKRIDDDQPLERTAIINAFKDTMSEHAWQKAFSREKDNGLISAKISHKKPYKYSLQGVNKWLISKGYIKLKKTETAPKTTITDKYHNFANDIKNLTKIED